MRIKIVLVVSAALLLFGCQSPETQRTRGAGPGADLGYHGDPVELHAGSEPYYETPQLLDFRAAPQK
jgi:hypothetical protein